MSKPLFVVCAAAVCRVRPRGVTTKARFFRDAIENRSLIIHDASDKLCETIYILIESVYKVFHRCVDLCCTLMAISFVWHKGHVKQNVATTRAWARALGITMCVNIRDAWSVHISSHRCSWNRARQTRVSWTISLSGLRTVQLRGASAGTWDFINSPRVEKFRM